MSMTKFDLMPPNRWVSTDLTREEIADLEQQRLDKMDEEGVNEREILSIAHDNITTFQGYFNENITRGKDDMNFVLRDQWTAVERSEFQRLSKPGMTFNFLYDTTKKVVAEQRRNKPNLMVRSLNGKATQQQVDLRTDIVRTIAYRSQNDLIYQSAFKQALMMGFGAFQIALDYETPYSFFQMPMYRMITDPTRCAFDPTAEKPHKGDGNFCSRNFIFTKEEFSATYPYAMNPESYMDPRSLLDFQWQTKDTIVVCDYYQKEWFSTKAYRLSNGQDVSLEEWRIMEAKIKKLYDMGESSRVLEKEIPKIIMERQTQDYKVMHYRLIKNQILEFSEWPSRVLPIIFVDGDSNFIEGMQYTRSFIHEAKDAQRFVNYVGSEVAGEIKNRRREQWLVTPDNISGFEQDWRNPEVQQGALRAKPDPKTGQMPQKQPAWELSQTLLAQYERGKMDIKSILGFHSDNDGENPNEQSGIAIRERGKSGSMSAFVWFDNFSQAIEQGGRACLDLLPYCIGDSEKNMVLNGSDGRSRNIVLNKVMPNGQIENEIARGDYDVEIDSGPSFAVQKEASVQVLMTMIQASPQVFPLVADLIAKNLDLEFTTQLAQRFESLVPPQILAKERGQPPPPQQPNPQEQMMQLEMQLKQKDMQLKEQKMKIEEAHLQERAEELRIRQQEHQIQQLEMLLKAKESAAKHESTQASHNLDLHKTNLDYEKELLKIEADMHKHQVGLHRKTVDKSHE